jgi:hypothetical protein
MDPRLTVPHNSCCGEASHDLKANIYNNINYIYNKIQNILLIIAKPNHIRFSPYNT